MVVRKRRVGLSDLPPDILSHILSFLNPREAVRTRLLSRAWRHIRVPPLCHLNLDSSLLFGCEFDDILFKTCDHSDRRKSIRCLQDQFVQRVDQLLTKLVTSPKLMSFKVSFFLGRESTSHVNQWIKYAVEKESESIDLDFAFRDNGLCRPSLYESAPFDFPCHLLPLGLESSLRHLSLTDCMLRPSLKQANGFNSLKSLKLAHVRLWPRVIEIIFSGCLMLEDLELVQCSHFSTLTICGQLPSLKWLGVDHCSDLVKIEISSVSLQTFQLIGMVKTLSLSEVPMLAQVYLQRDRSGWGYICDGELARAVPHLQSLYVASFINRHDHLPSTLTEFSCLQQLVIQLQAPSEFDLFELTSVLNASPVLEKLEICMLDVIMESDFNIVKQRKCYSYKQRQPYRHLKEVEFSGFCEKWNAVGFVKHLLKNAIALERMTVTSNRKVYSWGVRQSKQKVYSWGVRQFPYRKRELGGLLPDQIYNLLSKERQSSRAKLFVI